MQTALSSTETGAVRDKETFKLLQEAGLTGNRLKTWENIDAFLLDWPSVPEDAVLTIRNWVRDSPFFVPVVRAGDFEEVLTDLQWKGADVSTLYVQLCPDRGIQRVVNFEVYRNERFLWLTTGGTPPPGNLNLRHDLEQNGIHTEGPKALYRLKGLLSPESWDDLQELFDQYPFSVFEATEFAQPVGLRQRKLLIWEIRDY